MNIQNRFVRVYEVENKVVGYIEAEKYRNLYTEGGFNELGLAILPEFQGRGIGSSLLSSLEEEAREREFSFIRVNSEIEREEAHKFYQHQGYADSKTQKRFLKTISFKN